MCMNFSLIRFNGTRYSVQLPWKESHEELSTNYATSQARLKGLKRKLRKKSEVLREYNSIINDKLQAGIIERVNEVEQAENVHYLPHQVVIRKETETIKLKAMFDPCSKEGKNGTSFNDCLHVGPPLTPLLYDILLRFREKRIGIVAEIEKAFLNIEVDEKDRDCFRFLWIEDLFNDHSPTVIYRFCHFEFGVSCSPFS